MIKLYYQLAKPGYIFGNDLTGVAGFFLASKGHINWVLFIITMIAISLAIASASVYNNFIDQDIDRKMTRTQKRALVTGEITPQNALIFATILGVLSFSLFAVYTNFTTFIITAIGFFAYEFLYSFSKRHTIWSTVIGTIPGALVPVAGYTAVTGQIDLGAILLFLILAIWQLPHFYAISIYRRKEYENAGIPLLSVVKGILTTKIHLVVYTILFAFAVLALSTAGYTGKVYFLGMLLLSLWWIVYGLYGFVTKNTDKWAKKMFGLSLLINMAFCILVCINAFVF